jgi:tetratricopeptide (TPR) repeat protein
MGNGRKVLLRYRNASFGTIQSKRKAMNPVCFVLPMTAAIVASAPVFAQSPKRVIAQRQRQKEKLQARLSRIRGGDTRTAERVLKEFESDRKLGVLDEDNYFDRAQVYYEQGKLALAIADATKAIALKKDFHQALNFRGMVYASQKNKGKALADFNRAISLLPTRPFYVRNRGDLHFACERYNEAWDDYNAAVELDGTTAENFLKRGNASLGKGDYAAAIADYDKALELKPGLEEARKNREVAQQKKGTMSQ